MICPNCGTHVSDNAVRCPACRARLDEVHVDDQPAATYCPACGALVSAGQATCPKCGMPIESHDAEAIPLNVRFSDELFSIEDDNQPSDDWNAYAQNENAPWPSLDGGLEFDDADFDIDEVDFDVSDDLDEEDDLDTTGVITKDEGDSETPSEASMSETDDQKPTFAKSGKRPTISSEKGLFPWLDDEPAQSDPRSQGFFGRVSWRPLLAGLCVVMLAGGIAFFFLRPKPQVPAPVEETPQVEEEPAVEEQKPGSQEERVTLSGQDSLPGQTYDQRAVDERTYEALAQAYGDYKDVYEKLVANQDLLYELAGSEDEDAISAGFDEFNELKDSIDSIYASVGRTDVSTGTYEEDRQNMLTIGEWLMDWAGDMESGWQMESWYPGAPADDVLYDLYYDEEEGEESPRSLYEENIDGWEPHSLTDTQ